MINNLRSENSFNQRPKDVIEYTAVRTEHLMAEIFLEPVSWERMIRAVELVKERLHRATAALDSSGIPYAVIGGNAVASWVSRVDVSAVRNTQDVDLLIERADLDRVKQALRSVGFHHRHAAGIELFLDGEHAKPRDAVHVIFAGEKVRREYSQPAPRVEESEVAAGFRLLKLEPLVRMKLTSYRDKDRMHLRDMIDVGLIDATWPARFPSELGERLQSLLDNPE
jgi:hypothetical protein